MKAFGSEDYAVDKPRYFSEDYAVKRRVAYLRELYLREGDRGNT